MKIGTRTLGPNHPVYVIAEIGGNHDGSLDQAYELINAAKKCGADCAKFQFFDPDNLYPGKVTFGAISTGWLVPLQAECANVGVDFLCSVFDSLGVNLYHQVKPPAVKIASPEATNEELLHTASSLPMIVSTGAMDWTMTDRTNAVLQRCNADYALLHCVSAYPAEPAQMNLRVIRDMQVRYGVPVGLSDHTLGLQAGPLAVACGASIVEKHLTLDRDGVGPDHAFALEPAAFAAYVSVIRDAESMLGDGVKRVQESEDATDRRAA